MACGPPCSRVRLTRGLVAAVVAVVAIGGCGADRDADQTAAPSTPPVAESSEAPSEIGTVAPAVPSAPTTAPEPPAPAVPPTEEVTAKPLPPGVITPPAWLGTRVLPLRDDGVGEIQPTPPELVDRRLTTADVLPPPAEDAYAATVTAVPDDVLARSTWSPACPVSREELAYVTVSFWGFDERHHTGELLLAASVADDVVEVFRRLHQARFPLEEMRIIRSDELDLPPTGDGNVTTAFVCRPVRGASSWSQHAFGLAVDVNPFHNPYLRDDVVLPELASAYLDRDDDRPGMVQPEDVVAQAFAAIGWGWGGTWDSLKDWMHFSATGR